MAADADVDGIAEVAVSNHRQLSVPVPVLSRSLTFARVLSNPFVHRSSLGRAHVARPFDDNR